MKVIVEGKELVLQLRFFFTDADLFVMCRVVSASSSGLKKFGVCSMRSHSAHRAGKGL